MEAHRSPVASRDPVAWTGRGQDADPGGWTPEHTGRNVTCLLRIQTLRITGRLCGVSALHSGHRRRPFYLFIFGVQYRSPHFVCARLWGWEVGGCKVERSAFYGSSAKPCAAGAASRCQTTVPTDLMAPKDDKARKRDCHGRSRNRLKPRA